MSIGSLDMAFLELSQLRLLLTEQEVEEFDEKYGKLLSTVKADFIEKCKRAEEERKMRDEERHRKIEMEDRKLNAEYEMACHNRLKLEEANDAAFDDLCDGAKSLEEFYAYYGIENVEGCDFVKYSDGLTNKIAKFSCDKNTYYEDVRTHFVKLLKDHPDKRVSFVSTILFPQSAPESTTILQTNSTTSVDTFTVPPETSTTSDQ